MKFQHIVCDWPWWYANRLTGKHRTKFGGGAPAKYHTEKTSAAPEFLVADLADPSGCMLYFWVTGPHLFDAQFIINSWGFKYTTIGFNWVKTLLPKTGPQLKVMIDDLGMLGTLRAITKRGPGHYTASNTELVLLAWRNHPLTNTLMSGQIIYAPATRHSHKPFDVHEYIDTAYPGSQCIELFACPSFWTDEGNPGYKSPNSWSYLGFSVDGKDLRVSIPEVAHA